MVVEIYSKDNCPYCDMAIRLAEQHANLYRVFKLGEDFQRELMEVKFPNARTFPQIIVDNEPIGGYTEFKALIDNA